MEAMVSERNSTLTLFDFELNRFGLVELAAV